MYRESIILSKREYNELKKESSDFKKMIEKYHNKIYGGTITGAHFDLLREIYDNTPLHNQIKELKHYSMKMFRIIVDASTGKDIKKVVDKFLTERNPMEGE
jgi:hypothetical protein